MGWVASIGAAGKLREARERLMRPVRGKVIGGIGGLLAVLALAACGQSGPGANDSAAGPKPIDIEKELSALGPAAAPDVKALYEGEFEAVGSEPFWRLELLNDWASFTRPGLQDAGGLPSRRDYRAQGARFVAGPLVITLRAGACQHENGETFPYKAEVDFEGVSYDGCARRGDAAQSINWAAKLDELIPAIDACLARAENKPAQVTMAYAEDADISVRLLDAEGGRYECKTAPAGGAVKYWDTLADRNVMQGERDPLFTRAPAPAPKASKEGCQKSEAVKADDGRDLGWLTRSTC
jgi:uncharacterized membrane protein